MVVRDLQEKEALVLEQLLLDARAKISTISKNTKLSRDSVEYHIKKLQKEGIITRFTISLNEKKIGFHKAQIFLSTKIKKKLDEIKIIHIIQKKKYVTKISKCGAEYNFLIEISVQKISQINHFIEKISAELGESLVDYKTIFVDQYFKKDRGIANFRINSSDTNPQKSR